MIKVDFKTRKEKREYDNEEREVTYLVINGISDKSSFYSDDKIPYTYSHFYNDKVIDILKKQSFSEIGKTFTNIGFGLDVEWWDNWIDVDVYCNQYDEIKPPCIKLNLQIQEWEHWAKPWSISSVAKQFEVNVKKCRDVKIKYWQEDDESILNGFGVEYYPENMDSIIEDELSVILETVKDIVDKTNQNLLTSIDSEAVLTFFQFPDEIKTACKQYLVYFTQFISDMGIEVDTELKEELNHTLFKVVPKDKTESLDKIREALNIYLTAPSNKDFQVQLANQTDIAAKQWEANYYHLKSQLSLAQSLLQAKDATIEMLQIANYQYKQLLESHSAKKELEKEEVIKGIVTVKKYEGKGFTIDFAEIFRRLKRKIKK